MKSKDIFSLAVRILGLVFLYHGLTAVPPVIPAILAISIGNAFTGLLMVGWPLAVAYWLLSGAPLIMRIAYPDADGNPQAGPEVVGAVGKKTDP
jgi:hypothetical protein